jgi:hypothetical protein
MSMDIGKQGKGAVVMLSLSTITLVLFTHWVADFVLQSNWMAQGKSKTYLPLISHVAVYTLVLALIHPLWAIVNGILHLVVDYFTSRISSKLYAKGDIHNFFVVIGLDQFIHVITLLTTYYYIVL